MHLGNFLNIELRLPQSN